jgi:Ca2+-binding EF-hand superfamily protein
MMMDKDKVKKLVEMVKGIDKDHTGFVTRTELDDILKIISPELMKRDLTLIYRPFASNSNRILIEYKKFF